MTTENEEIVKRSSRSSSPGGGDRYHMEYYGTFKMDSVHGRLFELQMFIDTYNYHIMCYLIFGTIALLLGPFAALVAIPVAMIAGKDRDLQMFKVLLVLGTFIGILIWGLPMLIVNAGGGVMVFLDLIEKKQLTFLDVVDFVLAEFMVLLVIVFAWAYHDIGIDTDKYKEAAKKSWASRAGEYGVDVFFRDAQLQRLQEHLTRIKGEEYRPRTSSTVILHGAQQGGGGTIPIKDLITILEDLPGWHSNCLDVEDHMSQHSGEQMGMFDDLAKLADEAKEKKIWPIDIWLTRTQFYPDNELDLMTGLKVAIYTSWDMVLIVWHWMNQFPTTLFVLATLATIRSLLPRLWLWKVLGGEFWPDTPAGSNLVLYSTILTFVITMVWLSLFYMIVMEYRRTVVQLMITSSLVEPKARVKFSQSFLMSCLWFGMDSEQSEAVLSKLPLLDLRSSSNAAAFWRLREYCILDRSNERMCISVLLQIVIVWLIIKFLCTVLVMQATDTLPAILIVTLFDLVVFGGMAIYALQIALQINQLMEEHKQAVVNAKYMVTMAYGQCEEGDGNSQSVVDRRHDLEVSRRLLTEYLDIANEGDLDNKDSILFGMVVTPSSIVSSLASVGFMIGTLAIKMIKSGTVKVHPDVQEHVEKIALAAKTVFLAMYPRHS